MSGGYNPPPNPLPMTMGGTGSTVGPKISSTTVAGLPSAAASVGQLFVVTDSLLPALGAVIAGGGAVTVCVWSNGTNWIVM